MTSYVNCYARGRLICSRSYSLSIEESLETFEQYMQAEGFKLEELRIESKNWNRC